MPELTLANVLDAALKMGGPEFYRSRVPRYIYDNLKPEFKIRPYQSEAFGRFAFYWTDYHDRPRGVPTQLLYHMATGSGKTLIMAGLIIYLYEQGYRNFLFFVNSTNIIEKTRNNFLNKTSSKYLFSDKISIGNKQIRIKEVENFQASNPEDVNIVFSTIQGLHSKLNTPKENSITYEDFEANKIALISDEAHHINAETKRGSDVSSDEIEAIVSWERTVNRIFKASGDNILLEFTATADLSTPEINRKYCDKVIFDYPLRQFRKDGYSKEVKVLQADLSPFDRAMQGILLSQYRRKVFEKYKQHIKPVVLFKSRTIKESQTFFDDFARRIKNLKVIDLKSIRKPKPDDIMGVIFSFLEANHITLENFIAEIKEDFGKEKLISVNSKDESEQKQLAVNSLEDTDNEYRAVFAVDKLNEGWDVLNLFDIVRLYDTRDSKDGKPGKTTMSEAQLIGRGARYCPFQIVPGQALFERKYDDDVTNELRICEELYYHSAYNPRYIQELNTALEEIGIKPKETRERALNLKKEFTDTSFYKSGLLFLNEQEKYNRSDVFGLKSTLIEQAHKVTLRTGYTKSSIVFSSSNKVEIERVEKEYRLADFGERIIRKAIDRLEFYRFSNLKQYLPNLASIADFTTSVNYLGKIKIDVSGLPEQISNLSPKEQLEAATKVLEEIAVVIASDKLEYRGSKEFKPFLVKDKIKSKTMSFAINEGGDKEYGRSMIDPAETSYYLDLSKKKWYAFEDCFGTSEEKLLIKHIDRLHEKFKAAWDEIYLVRNERHVKIYNFYDGRAIEPDFILFLAKRNPQKSLFYQVFIEPKGEHLLKTDEWKENFLKALQKDHIVQQLWQDKKYVLWGLPFFNESVKKVEFDKAISQLLK